MVVLFFVWHFLSDGDFSFLMTLGSMLVLFGFGLLVAKALLYRKLSNLSYKTLQAYALVFMARLSSILFYEGYLPYDKSGDWFYQTVEVTALVLSVGLVVAVHMGVKTSDKDKFDEKLCEKLGVAGKDVGSLLLVVPVLILAVILHPSLNNNWLTDVAWTFALYLEAVAIFPQLYVIKSTKAEIDPLELNFVCVGLLLLQACVCASHTPPLPIITRPTHPPTHPPLPLHHRFSLAVARLLHFVFWVSSYQELNDKNSGRLDRKFRECAIHTPPLTGACPSPPAHSPPPPLHTPPPPFFCSRVLCGRVTTSQLSAPLRLCSGAPHPCQCKGRVSTHVSVKNYYFCRSFFEGSALSPVLPPPPELDTRRRYRATRSSLGQFPLIFILAFQPKKMLSKHLTRGMASGKDVRFGAAARALMLQGVDQ